MEISILGTLIKMPQISYGECSVTQGCSCGIKKKKKKKWVGNTSKMCAGGVIFP